MAQPWNQPNPPTTFDIKDRIGEVVLVVMGGYHERVPTREFGEKPAVRATVVTLTGRLAGNIAEDVMLWSSRIVSQFQGMAPGYVNLARVVQRDKSVTLEPYSSYDEQVALSWQTAHPGKLDQLRQDAIRQFREAEAKLAAGPQGPRPDPSPQWSGGPSSAGPPPGWATEGQNQPAQMAAGGQTLPPVGNGQGQNQPPAGGQTMASLQSWSQTTGPAVTQEQAGY